MSTPDGPFSELATQLREKRAEQRLAEWQREQEAVAALRPLSQDLRLIIERVQAIPGCRQLWACLYDALDSIERRITACDRRREAEIAATTILEKRDRDGSPHSL